LSFEIKNELSGIVKPEKSQESVFSSINLNLDKPKCENAISVCRNSEKFSKGTVNKKEDSLNYSKVDSMTKHGPGATNQSFPQKDLGGKSDYQKVEIESNSGIKYSMTENLSDMIGFFSQTQSNLVVGPQSGLVNKNENLINQPDFKDVFVDFSMLKDQNNEKENFRNMVRINSGSSNNSTPQGNILKPSNLNPVEVAKEPESAPKSNEVSDALKNISSEPIKFENFPKIDNLGAPKVDSSIPAPTAPRKSNFHPIQTPKTIPNSNNESRLAQQHQELVQTIQKRELDYKQPEIQKGLSFKNYNIHSGERIPSPKLAKKTPQTFFTNQVYGNPYQSANYQQVQKQSLFSKEESKNLGQKRAMISYKNDNNTYQTKMLTLLGFDKKIEDKIKAMKERQQKFYKQYLPEVSRNSSKSFRSKNVGGAGDGQDFISQYTILRKIGAGQSSLVRLIQRKADQKEFAMKTLKACHSQIYLDREINILSKLAKVNHPNLLNLVKVHKSESCTHLITEFFPGHTLTDFASQYPALKVPENEVRKIVKQICKGLFFCHRRGIAHRDLKHDNILIDKDSKQIKIIDFGYAIEVKEGELTKPECGSPNYMPPEIVRRVHYDPLSADVWSLGVIIYKLVSGKLPFNGIDNQELAKSINACQFEPIYPKKGQLNRLLESIFQKEAKSRPNIKDIL
jgi:hypothetical protein